MLKLEDFHIGFIYEELVPDTERYLNQGYFWRERTYSLESPRLHKIAKYIAEGKVRHKVIYKYKVGQKVNFTIYKDLWFYGEILEIMTGGIYPVYTLVALKDLRSGKIIKYAIPEEDIQSYDNQ